MIEYRIECRYDGGYEGRWQDTMEPRIWRGDDGKATALVHLTNLRAFAPKLWEYRLVSRTVTEWTEVET